ncbi:MAG TPA: DUF5681 domain-containing protein [Hyphomicrobiaceae bacterium]|nr:DUF5681 domain-containing protein [Hyphomicrobiaceae bacterium]
MAQFAKGQSGNPNGRPRKRRPNVSAFDIVFDKRLTVTENGVERELTVGEALELKTYDAALKGSKMAVRQVLKMIEKRERALHSSAPKVVQTPSRPKVSYSSDSANEAMLLIGILCHNPDDTLRDGPRPLLVETWAAQAALSRPGRRAAKTSDRQNLNLFVRDFDKVRPPRSRG